MLKININIPLIMFIIFSQFIFLLVLCVTINEIIVINNITILDIIKINSLCSETVYSSLKNHIFKIFTVVTMNTINKIIKRHLYI